MYDENLFGRYPRHHDPRRSHRREHDMEYKRSRQPYKAPAKRAHLREEEFQALEAAKAERKAEEDKKAKIKREVQENLKKTKLKEAQYKKDESYKSEPLERLSEDFSSEDPVYVLDDNYGRDSNASSFD